MTAPIRVYSRLLEPTEHPDYARRAVRPPTWRTFEGRTQFTCLRSFEVKDGRIVGHAEEIDKYTRRHALGRVIWPSYPILFAANLGELADAIARDGLYLFDVWGYVPGSGPGGYWTQFKAPSDALALLDSRLGERWLGTDIGEQDGRYINGYAGQMSPPSTDRFEQYVNFQRHFERMGDDLGHRHSTLVSLNFGHYLLKEGTYTLIGAETAQALPNNQVYYAFIRGAGKQYGVPWFGNASVFNRWGFKSYAAPGQSDGYDFGPAKGTSLSLLKRLLYTHLLYNGMLAGFEAGWLEGDRLTPIGAIQQAANRWVGVHGQPGVMHTPVALLLDFHAGWSFPRHLYSEKVYRVWGNLPYAPGDYLTDEILNLLYPGYQDSSYFHDESGFNVSTPFGDIADCLLSDAPAWLLERYPVVVVAGEISGGQEIRDKLDAYAASGGHLIITSGNLGKLPGGLGGRTLAPESGSFAHGQGRVTLFASPFGLEPGSVDQPIRSEVDRSLPKPFTLATGVRDRLAEIFRQQALFTVAGTGLSLVTCRKGPGDYTVGIANNTWRESSLRLESRCGAIESIRELELDQSEKAAAGYLPEGVDGSAVGRSGPERIAGGDIRIFAVRVAEADMVEIPHHAPPAQPVGRLLTLRHPRSIKEAILARPTFFEHFDGVVVDWRHLQARETEVLRAEAAWIRRQGLRIVVDVSSGLNLYPDPRLVDNIPHEPEASISVIEQVIGKMAALSARDLILSLHRVPENNFAAERTWSAFTATLARVSEDAAAAGVRVHVRAGDEKTLYSADELAALVARVGKANLKTAPMLSRWLAERHRGIAPALPTPEQSDFWLAAAPRYDIAGECCDLHGPLHRMTESERSRAAAWLEAARGGTIIFDAVLNGPDDEYREAKALR